MNLVVFMVQQSKWLNICDPTYFTACESSSYLSTMRASSE